MMNAVACTHPPNAQPDLASLRQRLVGALAPNIGVACTSVDGDPQRLWPEEQAAIRQAIPRRQREFAAGRAAAREAIAWMGWPPSAIPRAPDSSPVWPHGLVGSIAHSGRACVAIVGQREQVNAMGIDIEEDRPLGAPLWGAICTPEELALVLSLPSSEQGRQVTRLFCAKEAFYKWQHPQTGRMLDFHDVQIDLNQHCSGFSVRGAREGVAPVVTCRNEGHLFTFQGQLLAWLIGEPA